MNRKLDKLKKLCEGVYPWRETYKFSELGDYGYPAGFWIFPDGSFTVVSHPVSIKRSGHAAWVREFWEKHPEEKPDSPITLAWAIQKKKWVRASLQGDLLTHGELTGKKLRTAKDIAAFYGTDIRTMDFGLDKYS